MTSEKRLRRLEEKLEGYLEEPAEDIQKQEDPLAKKMENAPTISRALRSLRIADQHDEEPPEEAITLLKAGQADEDWVTILARKPELWPAFRKMWEKQTCQIASMDPRAKENLQKAEELADSDG